MVPGPILKGSGTSATVFLLESEKKMGRRADGKGAGDEPA